MKRSFRIVLIFMCNIFSNVFYYIIGRKINPTYVKKDTNYVEKLQADTKLMKITLKIEPLSIEDGISKFARYLNII